MKVNSLAWTCAVVIAVGATASLNGCIDAPGEDALGVVSEELCTGTGCNGQDPNYTGCDQGATTLAKADIRYGSTVIGRVDLRYSSACGAKWARTVTDSYFASRYPNATASLNSTRLPVTNLTVGTVRYFPYSLYTPMYTSVVKFSACGSLGGYWACTSER